MKVVSSNLVSFEILLYIDLCVWSSYIFIEHILVRFVCYLTHDNIFLGIMINIYKYIFCLIT